MGSLLGVMSNTQETFTSLGPLSPAWAEFCFESFGWARDLALFRILALGCCRVNLDQRRGVLEGNCYKAFAIRDGKTRVCAQ